MTQGSETQRPIAPTEARADDQGGVPGLWPAVAVAALSGIVCWMWLMSGAATATAPKGGAEAVLGELARVDDRDVSAALATIDGSTAFLTQFKEHAGSCPRPLAWVTLVSAPGEPPGQVRLRSGRYFSPVFNLSDVPVRVAIPYPSPYETGHGKLTVMDVGGGAVVALLPAWHVSARDGDATREVIWHPGSRCKQPNG